MHTYDDLDPFIVSEAEQLRLRDSLARDGYVVYRPQWEDDVISALRKGVHALDAKGWQASFASVYDEAWMVAYLLQDVVSAATGGKKIFNHDWLGYLVESGEAGMPPHRDFPRCPEDSWHDSAKTLPKMATVWLALSDATPENSCLYFLPANKDEKYRSNDCESAHHLFTNPEMFQDIVAVPLKAGEVLIFSHRVYHWGSAVTPNAVEPRVALAMGFSDPDYKAPHLRGEVGVANDFPPLSHRVALCAAQMLIYNKRHAGPWPLTHSIQADMATLLTLRNVFQAEEGAVQDEYCATVRKSPIIPHLLQAEKHYKSGSVHKEVVLEE